MHEKRNCISSLKQKGVLFGYIKNIMSNSLRSDNLNPNNNIDNVDNVLINLWIFDSAKIYLKSNEYILLKWFCLEILSGDTFPTKWKFDYIKDILDHYFVKVKVDKFMFSFLRDKKTLDKISLIWDLHNMRDVSKLSYELYNFYINDNLLDSAEKKNLIAVFPELWTENQVVLDQVIDSKKHISDLM